ncbi:MAG: phosphate acyltransferase, partial [Pseudomonadota bacterium]
MDGSATQTRDTAAQADSRAPHITISVDAMGGDQGPSTIVTGLYKAARSNPDLRFVLHGREEDLKPHIDKRRLSDVVTIRNTRDVVSMHDKPAYVMRNGKGTSMWSAIEAVRSGEADVCVSCGNTGALMAVSMVRLRKLPGVNRPAIAVLWPSENPQGFNVMLDAGADIRA